MTRRSLEYSLTNGSHLLYLHLPKTAGTSLACFLDRHVDRDRTVQLDVFEALRVADRDTCLNATYLIASHTYYDLVYKALGTHPVCITSRCGTAGRCWCCSAWLWARSGRYAAGGGTRETISAARHRSLVR